jgi:large subunit ribosomal protein L40
MPSITSTSPSTLPHAIQHSPRTMRPLSPVLASLANVFRIPLSQAPARPAISRLSNDLLIRKPTAPVQPAASATAVIGTRPFSTTSALLKRSKNAPRGDKRISMFFISRAFPPEPRTTPRSIEHRRGSEPEMNRN